LATSSTLTSLVFQRPQIEDALVGDQPGRPEYSTDRWGGVGRQFAASIADSVAALRPSPPIIAMYIHEIGRMLARVWRRRHRRSLGTRLGLGGARPMAGKEASCAPTATVPRPTTAAMRNAERLVQVQMRHVGANSPGAARPTSAFRFAPST
jgi:hypothetical protein